MATDLDPRRALQVTRYHTWPRIREQSVGEHSVQVARLLLAIWPDAPKHLILHALFHDVGEVRAGDPPYPAKKLNADLARGHEAVERAAHLEMALPWQLPAPVALTRLERWAFKLADFLDMWEWGLYEGNLGNRYADLVAERCMDALRDMMEAVPDVPVEEPRDNPLGPIIDRLKRYMTRRSKVEKDISDG